MTTEQLELALGARHAGQFANLAAGAKPHRDDRARVELAVATLARSGSIFTADDVHRLVKHDANGAAYDPNLVSSVLGIWAKDGRIQRQGNTASARQSRHASRNGIWRGKRGKGNTPAPPSPRTGN